MPFYSIPFANLWMLNLKDKLSNKYGILAGKSWNIDIPILKNGKSFYVNYSMSVASDLSSHESDAVFDFLSEDVKVHQILVDRFAGH